YCSFLLYFSLFLRCHSHPSSRHSFLHDALPISAAASILIGTVTLTGSTVAFAKLQELMSGAPKTYPGQRIGDSLLGLTMLAAAVMLVVTGGDVAWAWTSAGLAAVLGVTRVLPIGGADMPVVISFLNSLSGLAAAAAGFVIESNALIVSGALVGAAGLILPMIMVRAMNRTLGD